jgi:NAD(P)-dependent dehydrogenase (short-subunit alcohol dehydrogenase family)
VTDQTLQSFPEGGVAVILGASGGIGAAVLAAIQASGRFATVLGYHRRSVPSLELTDEASIAAIADQVKALGQPVRLVFDATGVLQGEGTAPEKSWRQLDPAQLARAFAVNAIGPALLKKHLLPLLDRQPPRRLVWLSRVQGRSQPVRPHRCRRTCPSATQGDLRGASSRDCRHRPVGAACQDRARCANAA